MSVVLTPKLDSRDGRRVASEARVKVFAAAFICVLCILFAAGLWPFHAPRNNVTWSVGGDGLCFGWYGSAVSAGSFRNEPDKSSGTIELWLEPAFIHGSRTILSLDSTERPGAPFEIRQLDDNLVVQQDSVGADGHSWTVWSVIKSAFHARQPVFVTIVLSERRTSVYLNGSFNKDFDIGETRNNLTGLLLLANSPRGNSWSGILKGLAIHNRQLTQGEVLKHYESWLREDRSNLDGDKSLTALYLFDERTGDRANNRVDPQTYLKIPKRYFILRPPFLEAPWRSYHPTRSYWKGVIINVVGFIPLGVVAALYFSSVRQMARPVAIAIVLGFAVSLTIEILQVFLPTRNSGMDDLVTNTFGTALGAILCSSRGRANWLFAWKWKSFE
jgi:hypothetical protein